jgi:hypothetical protein
VNDEIRRHGWQPHARPGNPGKVMADVARLE